MEHSLRTDPSSPIGHLKLSSSRSSPILQKNHKGGKIQQRKETTQRYHSSTRPSHPYCPEPIHRHTHSPLHVPTIYRIARKKKTTYIQTKKNSRESRSTHDLKVKEKEEKKTQKKPPPQPPKPASKRKEKCKSRIPNAAYLIKNEMKASEQIENNESPPTQISILFFSSHINNFHSGTTCLRGVESGIVSII